jgi:hypothetical protein
MSSLQPPADSGSPLADFSTPKMEAIRSSETSVNTGSTQRHIPEDDSNLRLDGCLPQIPRRASISDYEPNECFVDGQINVSS